LRAKEMKGSGFLQLSRKEIWLNRLALLDPHTIYRLTRRSLRRRRKEYRKIYRMTLRRWLLFHNKHIVFEQCRWMGVHALKNPLDAWIFQEIIFEVQPEVIVEIGSATGGTTLFLANMLDLLGAGSVVSVDIDHSQFEVSHDRILTVTGNSSEPAVVAQVAALCEGKSVLVIHDGDHNKPQVLKDISAYAPLVTVGSYFIVEDGLVDLFKPNMVFGLFPDGGPLEAVEEYLQGNNDFMIDRDRERYLLTFNPMGYLKRVR
jgi:cephalosporin hydroxylase